jgi:hypothetical protein
MVGGAPGGARLPLPLRVVARPSVHWLAQPRGFELDPSQQRMLDAMTFYAALGGSGPSTEVSVWRRWRKLTASRTSSSPRSRTTCAPAHDHQGAAHGMQSHADERAGSSNRGRPPQPPRRRPADLSRLSAGGLKLTIEVVPVDDLISTAVQRVEGALGERRLDVSLGDAGSLLVGRLDLAHSVRIL